MAKKTKSVGMGYFSEIFKGRLGRADFFLATVLLSIIMSIVMLFLKGAFMLRPIVMLLNLLSILIEFSFAVRRAHDLDWSGFTSLLLIIPVVNIVFICVLLFMPGTKGSNKYGKSATGEFLERTFKPSLLGL